MHDYRCWHDVFQYVQLPSGNGGRSLVNSGCFECGHSLRSGVFLRGDKLMRTILALVLVVGGGCSSGRPVPEPPSLPAPPTPDAAEIVDLMPVCSMAGGRCGTFDSMCCNDPRSPLVCVGGACTLCAKSGAGCSTLPCCDGLTCNDSQKCVFQCIECDPNQTSGGPCTPSRCAKSGDVYCCVF